MLTQKFNSVLIRVYIIPEMGYVDRRLDCCTPEGEKANMAMRFETEEAVSFTQIEDWIPEHKSSKQK